MKLALLLMFGLTLSFSGGAASAANQSGGDNLTVLGNPQTTKVPYSSAAVSTADTGELQAQVLTKINQALSRGAIAPEEATTLKDQLNTINHPETWYESHSLPVPESVLAEDAQHLKTLSADVDRKMSINPSPVACDVMHKEIHKLITNALAGNKITNAQAEGYYSRLAQLEADMESLKNDRAQSTSEWAALNQNLQQLEEDLHKRL